MRADRQRRFGTPRWAAVLTTLVVALLAVGLVLFLAPWKAPGNHEAHPLPPPETDAGPVHVHGLGIDPADGMLYAATHTGLYRLAVGDHPVRVANREQDTMGFTVVGPRTFLGSGHPDSREDDVRPPLLGLLESTDAGQTWKRLSLHGKADFHVLRAAHGRVYGYDSTSGTLMVSDDRREWQSLSRLPMRDFAVSPSDPLALLATTERGTLRSRDGGRTWAAAGEAPALALLAWTPASIYGVGPTGKVYMSESDGATWAESGDVGGQPEAFSVNSTGAGTGLFVSVADRGILESTDGAKTFTVRYAG